MSPPLEHDPNFKGPIQKRSCTDIICCFIFLVFVLGMAGVAFFAYYHGNPNLLLFPTDSNNELCGYGKYKDKKYLYFYNLLNCLGSGPGIFVTGCPTPQVCVKECPKKFVALYRPGMKGVCPSAYCTDGNNTGKSCNDRIKDKKCPPFLVASSPILNRCVPLIKKLIGNFSSNMFDNKGENLNKNGTAFEKFSSAVLVIRQFLRLKQFTDKIISDVVTTWWLIVIGYLIASIVSFIWIVLMRWIARPILIITIFLFLGLFGFACFWCIMKYIKTKDSDIQFYIYLAVTEFSFRRSKFWLALGIISVIILAIVILILLFLRKRIQIALSLISEGSKAVGSMMFTLVWPIVPFILEIGTIALWITVAIYLASTGRGKNLDDMNAENITDRMNKTSQSMLKFMKCDSNDSLADICGFLKYGTSKYTFYLQIYNLFMFFWLINFVVALGQMTLSGAFASYYWAMEKPRDIPSFPLGSAFYRCFRYHLGTLAFGSLLIAIVKIIRTILEYIHHKLKKSENKVAAFFLKCCICCFWCLEKFLKFLNKNAYIMVAVYGKNFCTSARKAFMLIMRNAVRVVVVDKVADFLLFIGKLVVVGGVTAGSFMFFDRRIPGLQDHTPTLHYYLAPVIIIAVGTYIIASCFFSVYSMAVDSLFLCFLEDLERNDGSPEKPYYMNKSLMKILNKKQTRPSDGK